MKFHGLVACALAFGLLAGCETTTTTPMTAKPAASKAATPRQEQAANEFRGFMVSRSKAEVYAKNCAAAGIRLREPVRERALIGYTNQMKRQGYSEMEVLVAMAMMGKPTQAIANSAIKSMEAMGAQRGNPASLCVAAKREIAAKTGAGSQLVYRP